jgi:hypothetical protein
MQSSHVYAGVTKENFTWWLKRQWQNAIEFSFPNEDVLLFINAWNEWAEGAQLEPSADDDFDKLDLVSAAFTYANEFYLGRNK